MGMETVCTAAHSLNLCETDSRYVHFGEEKTDFPFRKSNCNSSV